MFQEEINERGIACPRRAQQRSRALRQYRVAAAILRDVTIGRTALELKIGIRASVEQHPGDVKRGDCILTRQHRHRAVSLGRQRADVGGHIERRASEEIPFVHVGASFDHGGRDLEMQVEQRHVERRDALGVFEIWIGPGRDQVSRALNTALAGGIEQRSETTLVQVLGTWLCDDLAFPLADDTARVEVGACEARNFTISAWLCAAAHIKAD